MEALEMLQRSYKVVVGAAVGGLAVCIFSRLPIVVEIQLGEQESRIMLDSRSGQMCEPKETTVL